MANYFEVIDADGHITEEDNEFKQYMESRYRDRAATLTPRVGDRSLGGTLVPTKDAKTWLDAMDKGGVSSAISDVRAEASAGFGSRMSRWPTRKPGTTSWPRNFRLARGSKRWRWFLFRMCRKRSRSCAGR